MTSAPSENEAREAAPKNPPAVLLLDDDTNTLFVLHTMLESTGARVIECADEKCVIHWCEELAGSLDLLIADVILPAGNGPAVVRKIKPLQPMVRVVFISGFSLSELERRGLLGDEDIAPGHVEFLQKPFSPNQFLTTVEALLRS